MKLDIFTHQFDMIKAMGFWEWLSRYPINPVTMVAAALVVGLVVLFANSRIRRRNAERHKPAGASILVIQKRNGSNGNFAENVRVSAINGEKSCWFFHKAAAAVYLGPGENVLEVYAQWARGGRTVTLYRTNPVVLTLTVASDKIYALHYDVRSSCYLLTEGDAYEDETWERSLTDVNLVDG